RNSSLTPNEEGRLVVSAVRLILSRSISCRRAQSSDPATGRLSRHQLGAMIGRLPPVPRGQFGGQLGGIEGYEGAFEPTSSAVSAPPCPLIPGVTVSSPVAPAIS